MANHNQREGIEAIGSKNAAAANAANNLQIPQRQVTVQAPTAPAGPAEVEQTQAPAALRRGDVLNLSPMASQKVIEHSVVGPTKYVRNSELQELARQSPHGDDLAAIAKGEMSAEDFQQSKRDERESN